MTKINKIVASGFKSFAKWTEFPFSGDYNVVLGPNGSGKSNLLDALCFVLGRTSSKSMRAEKLAHLIYNGGKSKKPAGKAEVSIYFDNSSKIFQRDDPEIKITRGVKQNGQGVYRINDERCTRQQIIDLMSLAKVDPDGHNIILQGDIVRFVEMSSEESRQVIEEAAGISVYEDKKQKAMTELGHVEERLKEADIILSERKGQLKELKEDRDQALKYKDVNDRIRQTKATHLSLQMKRLEKQKGSVDEETKAQKKQTDALQESITGEKKQAEERKLRIKGLNEQIEEKGEKEQLSLHKSIEEIKVSLGTDNHRISYCDSESKKMEEKKSQLQSEAYDFEKKIERIITFSTSEVYGSFAIDVSEDDSTCIGPVSEGRWSYAVSKVASDHLARAYFKKYELPINMVRPFNIYGPRQVGEGSISNMLTSAIKTGKIFVTGDGLQKRAWCYISDMARAVELILKRKVYGECFNIGNPKAYVTILELAKKIQAFVKGSEIIFIEGRKVEVLDRKPNIEKANRFLGFVPEVELDEGLKLTFEWWKKNISKF